LGVCDLDHSSDAQKKSSVAALQNWSVEEFSRVCYVFFGPQRKGAFAVLDNEISASKISQELRSALAAAATPFALSAKESLFTERDEGDALFFILDGRLEISIVGDDGRKLGLDVLSKGAFFGEIALLDPGPRTATVVALEDCQLLMLRHADLLHVLEQDPHLMIEMLRLVGKRMRQITDQLHEQILLPLHQRLARKLLRLASGSEDENPSLRLSHSEIADQIGASREAVSKALSSWNKQGILQTGRGAVELLDEAELRSLAGL
jgi:CRP-like cAMP-binding protein